MNTLSPSDLRHRILHLLQLETTWARARLRRIAAEQITEHQRRAPFGREPSEPVPLHELRRRETAAEIQLAKVRAEQEAPIGLDQVQRDFALSDLERHTLLLATALTLERTFGDVLGELDGGAPGFCSVETVFVFEELDLTARVDARESFRPTAPLFAHDLAELSVGRRFSKPEQLLEAAVSITSRGLELILGTGSLAEELMAFSKLEAPRATFDQVVLPDDDRSRLLAVLDGRERLAEVCRAWGVDEVVRAGRGTLVLLSGPPGTGKTTTAHAIAARLGKRVLQVDIPTFSDHQDSLRFLPGLFREARLHDALLFFDECEALFQTRRAGNTLMTLLLTELERFEGIAVLATNLPQVLDEALDRRILVRIDFPHPDAVARESLWKLHIPPRAKIAGEIDVAALARRHDLAGGYIKNAMLNAVAAAVAENPEQPRLAHGHLDRAARDQARRVASLPEDAGLREARATLDDVVLPPREQARIAEIVDAALARSTVFDRWGVGARQSGGRGLVALFHGPPGTGKSLCAEAIAGTLGRPLLRLTLPSILSRWVGEAERALARAFRDAAAADAVLVLDEADALLMARGEGRSSRHDDGLVVTLLDQIDRCEGIVVLTTNRPAALDAALPRRVTWSIGFPVPDADARVAIWRALVPPAATGDAPVELAWIAGRYELTGGQIRTAAVRAAMRAARAQRALTGLDLARSAAEEAGEPDIALVPHEVADA